MQALAHSTGSGQSLPAATDAGGEHWIATGELARLLAVTRQAIEKRARAERWPSNIVGKPGGGIHRILQVAALPAELQTLIDGAGVQTIQRAQGTAHRAQDIPPGRDPATGLTWAETWENAREADREIALQRRALLDQAAAWVTAQGTGEPAQGTEHRGAASGAVPCAPCPVLSREALDRFAGIYRQANPDARVSGSTLDRWRRLGEQTGVCGLLPRYAIGARGHDVPEQIGDLVGKYYLDRNQRKLSVAYEIARVETARLHPQLLDAFPSIATLRRYVRWRWPMQAIILARQGDTAFRQQCLPYIAMDPRDHAVMDLWTSDSRVHDVWVAGLDGRRMRPWVTDWRDKRTSFRVGWTTHDGPSASTILAAFAVGVRRYGIPRGIQIDNDRAYSTPAFAGRSRRWTVHFDEPRVRGLLEHLKWVEDGVEHQVQVHFTIPREPQGKGSHETQFHHQDAEWFDKLWTTYCGKDPNSRPEHLQQIHRRKDGLPTLVEFNYLFGVHAAGINHRPSDAQDLAGRTPAEVFAVAEYTKRTATDAALRILLMKPTKPLTVQKNGIYMFDRYYWSETIAQYLGQRVYVRYDLDEIGRLLAFTLEDQYLDTLERVDLLSVRATEADARKAWHRKKVVRAIARQAQDVRDQIAANPDLITHMAEARTAAYAEQGKETPRPDRPRAVVHPIRTPFDAASKQIESRDTTRADRATLDTEAREIRRIMRDARAPDDAPAAGELEAEAMALRGKLRVVRGQTSDVS